MDSEVTRQPITVLSSDLRGFSRLSDANISTYVKRVLLALAEKIDPYREYLIDLNTWGDAIFATSRDTEHLARMALDIRDFFRHPKGDSAPLIKEKRLSIRIALDVTHAYLGPKYVALPPEARPNPTQGCFGSGLTLAARLEPVTPPNAVFVTEDFKGRMPSVTDIKLTEFDGVVRLPKGAGDSPVWLLHWDEEEPSFDWKSPTKKLDAVAPIHVDSWLIEDKSLHPKAPFHRDRHAEVTSRLAELAKLAKCGKDTEACFITITGRSIIFPALRAGEKLMQMSPVASALKDGVRFRGILLNPECEEAAFRSWIESGSRSDGLLQNDAGIVAGIPDAEEWKIKELQNRVPQGLELKYTKRGLSFNLWLFPDRAIIEPYHLGKIHSDQPHTCKFSQFTIYKEREEEYQMLRKHFENLWNDGDAVHVWPHLHGDRSSSDAE